MCIAIILQILGGSAPYKMLGSVFLEPHMTPPPLFLNKHLETLISDVKHNRQKAVTDGTKDDDRQKQSRAVQDYERPDRCLQSCLPPITAHR